MNFTLAYRQKIKETLTLSLPIIAGQLGQVLMGFFDTVQIGGLGHQYIAASGFANGIYWMVILLGLGILFAISPLVSESFGQKKEYKSIGVLFSGLWVSVVLTLVFMLAVWLIADNIQIFRHTETDNRLGSSFLKTVNWSTGFVFFFMAGKQFLDGMGKTKVGMYITVAGLVLNFYLNSILIYGKLGLPALGIEGAALANSISRVAMTVAIFLYIIYERQVRHLYDQYKSSNESGFAHIKPILVIGIPSGLQFFWEVGAFNAGQIMSGWISTEAEAAHMVAIGLASITFMVLSGVSAAGTIMVGFAYGSQDKESIRISGNTVIGITLATELFFALLFFSFMHELPKIYTDEWQVISLASGLLWLAAFFQISDGLQAVGAGLLRGVQDVKVPAAIAFVCYWLVMIPSSYFLAFQFHLGLTGIWIGFLIGLSLAAFAMLARFKYVVKRLPF